MVYYYKIAVASKSPLKDMLTYSCNLELRRGTLVSVEVKSQRYSGVVVEQVNKPDFKTLPIRNIYEEEDVLPRHLMDSISWLSSFYRSPISSIVKTILPAGLGAKRQSATDIDPKNQLSSFPLTARQSEVINQINSSAGNVWLHGNTGSGKTRIYVGLVNEYLKQGKDCIVMTPEIGLTPQLVKYFEENSEAQNIYVIHSKITESKKHKIWRQISKSSYPSLVIGTRSSIFMPLKNLGLIIIDEAHDSSYKQDSHPKYNLLRLAGYISDRTNSKVLFGTATPPISEIYYAAKMGLKIIKLEERVFADNRQSTLIDMRDKSKFKRHKLLSDKLIQRIEYNISNDKQTLMLLNRRGTRSNITCDNCGWFASCKNCRIPLHYHHDDHKYTCHLCGNETKPITTCPDCGITEISMSGYGTKQIEIDVKRLFPTAKVVRYDQDSISAKTTHAAMYEKIKDKNTDIVIGTQLISKGFDLDRLTTVAAIQADKGLQLPDFSSAESTFQMLYQLSGRAGRRGQISEVLIQTMMPDHYAIDAAYRHSFDEFYNQELRHRKPGQLPPYTFLLLLRTKLKTQSGVIKKASDLALKLSKIPGIKVMGPSPALYEFSRGYYTWQIVIAAKNRKKLTDIIDNLPNGWDYDIDPINLL